MSQKSKLTSGVFSNRTDEWKTPSDLYKKLNSEFKFELDAAATSANALCKNYFSKKDNALTKDWSKYKSVFCNPPYSKASAFVEKAYTEAKKGCTVVMLIPFRSDTKYYHDFIINKAKEVRLIKGRLHYSNSEQTAPFPSAIIVFENTNKKTQFCSTSKQGVRLAGINTLKRHQKKTMTNHEYLRQEFGKNKGGTADFSPDTWEVANEVYIMEKEYDDEGFDIVKRVNNGDEDYPEYEFEVLKSIYLDDNKNTIEYVASEARRLSKNNKLKGTNMITADNYFDEIPAILDRLPSEVKDAHELVSAMKKDGIDNPFNTGDADIDSMGELLLEKANSILAKAEKKETKTADSSQRKPKAEKPRGIKITKAKAEPKPKNNTVDLSQRKPAPKKTFKRFSKKSKPSKKGKTISRKTAQKITRKAIKQVRKSDAQKPSVTKKIFTKELQLIKAFIANDKKEVSVGVLKAKHAAVKNALKDGKTNQHQETLRNISVRYGKAIGAIKGTATHIKCNIEKSFILKLKDIVVGAKIKVRTDVLGGMMNDVITCKKCNWKWNYEDGGNNPYVCHHCGYDNANGLSGVIDDIRFIIDEFENTKPYLLADSIAEYLSEKRKISNWLDNDEQDLDEETKVQLVSDAIYQNYNFSDFSRVDDELINDVFNSNELSKNDMTKFVKWLKENAAPAKK